MRRKPGDLLPLEAGVLRYAAAKQEGFYGWQLVRELTDVPSATIYRNINRLSSAGLLTGSWVPSETPGLPPRRIYQITERGRELSTTAGVVPVSNPWSGQLGARAI